MVVSGVTGSERALAPGTGLVLEVVRLSVNEQFRQLVSSLYPGELAICPLPFGSIDGMWLALGALANDMTSDLNGGTLFSLTAALSGRVCFRPVGPSPAALGHGLRCGPSQTSDGTTDSKHNPVIMNVSQDSSNPWVSSPRIRTGRFLIVRDLSHYIVGRFSTDDHPLLRGLRSPTARPAVL